jgi:hypothetical protein
MPARYIAKRGLAVRRERVGGVVSRRTHQSSLSTNTRFLFVSV